MYQNISAPTVCQWEITSECTHNCKHCYNFWRKDDSQNTVAKNKRLNRSEIQTIVKKLADAKVFEVVFTGGEPLADYGTLKICLEEAKKADLGIKMNSNLIPLTEQRAKELRDLGVTTILTSIMGPTAQVYDEIAQRKGTFSRLIKNIRIAQDAGIQIFANMVVSKSNLAYVKETARLVQSLGIKSFSATKAGCPGNCFDFSDYSLTIDEFRQYLQDLAEVGEELNMRVDALEGYPLCGVKDVDKFNMMLGRKCFAGVTTMSISCDGSVRPCSRIDTSCGNLLKEEFSVIWERMQPWRDGEYLPEICKGCKLLKNCGGGCRMEAKMRNGSLIAQDPYCSPEDINATIGAFNRYCEQSKVETVAFEKFTIGEYKRRDETFGVWILPKLGRMAFLSLAGATVLGQFITGVEYIVDDDRIAWGSVDSERFVRRLIGCKIANKVGGEIFDESMSIC